MRRNLSSRLAVLLLFIVLAFGSKNFADFTYTQYTVVQTQRKSRDIHIHPQRSILDYYEFPQACQIDQLLNVSYSQVEGHVQISNIDGEIDFLKQKVSQFLKLSDKAELIQRNIKNLPHLKNDSRLIITQRQLVFLEQSQRKLHDINNQINERAIQLQKLVHQNMKDQQNPIFKQAHLNFQRRALQQKITLLQTLSTQARQHKQQNIDRNSQKILDDYFSQLRNIFDTESGLIDAIDTLLRNHNELGIIKAKISSLNSQIKAHDLTISQKQQCRQQYSHIQQKQKHDQHVVQLIETLKLKKKQFNEPNKYCQGVVEKLIDRVKKLLAGYNYIFLCAQGLEETKLRRNQLQHDLDQAQRKLNDLQMSKGVSQFKRNFQHNRQLIQSKMNDLKSLKLDPYYQDPTTIGFVISSSRQRISQIDHELATLPAKQDRDWTQAQVQIKKAIIQIKNYKAAYCQQNEIYISRAKQIQDKLYALEQQEEFNRWLRRHEIEKLEELENVKRQMAEIQIMLEDYMR